MTGTAQTPSVTATANLDTEITSKNRSTTTVTVKSSTKAHLKKFTNLFQPIRQIPLTWTLALLTCAVFTLTVCYASFATVAARSRMISTSWSNTILVLRVLSGITELLMIALLAATFERIQWMLVSRTRGLSLLSFLGLSSGVSVLGLLWLVFMRGARKWSCRSWSIFRYVSVCFERIVHHTEDDRLVLLVYVPVLGYVIMSKGPSP